MAGQIEMMRRQRALAEFGDFVLDHDDLDQVLNEGCRLIAEALGADLAKVIEIELEARTGFVRAGVGWNPGIVGRERISLTEQSSETYAIEKTEPVITNDIAEEQRFVFPGFLRDHGVVALVNVPILLPGRRPWGVLQVDARQPRAFDQEDIEFLKTYAMILGPVIDRFRVAAEREQARSGLVEREERLRRVLEGMGEGFGLLAPDFTILGHNREALRLDGRPREAIVGRSHWEAYPGSEDTEVGQLLKTAMSQRTAVSLEHRYDDGQGRSHWLEMRAYPTADGGLAVFWRDVTHRREAADALRESEERYRALFETMDEAYAVVEVLKDDSGSWSDFRFVEVNPAFIEHTAMTWPVGKTATELLGAPNPRWTRLYGRALDTGLPVRVEADEPTLGRTFDLNIFSLDRDRNRVAVLFTNITERKRAEVAARENSERLALAIDIGELASWDWNLVTGEVKWSDRHFLMQGYTVGEVTPSFEAWLARVHPDDRGKAVALIESAKAQGTTYIHAFRTIHPDGSQRWCSARGRFFYDAVGQPYRMIGVMEDVTERKQAEQTLRAMQDRQAFLLELSDALRPLSDTEVIRKTTSHALGRRLGANRVAYAENVGDGQFHVSPNFADGVANVVGLQRYADFGADLQAELEAGRTRVQPDIRNENRLTDAEKQRLAEVSVGASLNVPLVKNGRLVAFLGVNYDTAHDFHADEIELVSEVAERTWAAMERARAERAQRESEERFRQFAHAASDALWIRDAASLEMEYVSPATAPVYGVEAESFLGDIKHWAAAIVPEDREAALRHVENARVEACVHEFRIQRASDQAFRWIKDTAFPLRDAEGRVRRIGGIAEDVTEAKLAVEHQGVLLAELQHRVRNIMAMIRSVTARTANGAGDVEDYRALLEGRLLALARVQVLLTREANAGGSLRDILSAEISAQAHHGEQFVLVGPDVRLSPKAVEVLTLAFHELATNALKYGALSIAEGRVRVTWTPLEHRGQPWLSLDWSEEGALRREPSKRRGFGSELIEGRIPYELGGSGKLTVEADGAHCHLEFPLKDGESILETDAPTPVAIFGGTLDMTGAADLTGHRVLVVEDDYYIAGDIAAALRGAGADVLGPCPNEDAAFEILEGEGPTHAVLDLNLGGGGPQFELARALKARGVPFVFTTGYDPGVIPPELQDIVRLQKPTPFRKIIDALGEL